MILTEKGKIAFDLAWKYCRDCKFSAAQLSELSGQKVVAATFNAIASKGYMTKFPTKPVTYAFIENIEEILQQEEKDTEEKGCKNTNLNKAKKTKNDEFYTRYEDIAVEVELYKECFKDKVILCNCNDGHDSNFYKYFKENFTSFGLSKLICLVYNKEANGQAIIIENDAEEVVELQGNGDFNSEEGIKYLQEADIAITNPPFSLFRDFMTLILQYDKKFLIICSKNSITYKIFFPLLKNKKAWAGCHNVGSFIQPDGTVAKFGNVGWATNLFNAKKNPPLNLTATYYDESNKKEAYEHYDDYPEAINVDKVVNIPSDFFGPMGVPISYIDKHCPEQFEILGLDDGRVEWRGKNQSINGKEKYRRLIIQRKK